MPGSRSRPFLLLRFPGMLVAVLGAVAILAATSAAGPLFLSSASNASLEREIAASRGRVPAFSVTRTASVLPDIVAFRDALMTREVPGQGLGPPRRSIIGSQATVLPAGGAPSDVLPFAIRVVSRDGWTEHVDVIERVDGEGVWLADRAAAAIGVAAGDRIGIQRPGGAPVGARVVAIYGDLPVRPQTAYWVPIASLVYPLTEESAFPPPLLLMDARLFLRIQARLDDRAEFHWEYPLDDPGLTLAEGHALAARINHLQGEFSDETRELGQALESASTDSPVERWVEQSELTVQSIRTPVDTIALAGRAVAIAVVAVAGVYVVRRRRVEFLLLHARGVSPTRQGARVAVETLLPAAAGAAAGWAAAVGLLSVLGPGALDGPSIRQAGVSVAWGTAAAVLLLGVSAGVSARTQAEEGTSRFREAVARVPWEAVVLVLAAAALYETVIRKGEAVIGEAGSANVDRLLLLFPLLLVAGGAGLAVRGLRRLLPRLRALRAERSPAVYLSARRLAGAPRTASLLVTASAMAVGVLAYSGLLSSSIRGTAEVKARVAVGSETSVSVGAVPEDRDAIRSEWTSVVEVTGVATRPGDIDVDVLGVDPATFADAAFWESGFSGDSLESLMSRLAPRDDGVLAVIVAAGALPEDESLYVTSRTVPIEVVGTADAFPGQSATRPLVVAGTDALRDALQLAGTSFATAHAGIEVWARGDGASVTSDLERAGIPVYITITVADVARTPGFQSLAWTFGLLQSLGITAGLVALVGVLLYLQSRQRQREVSYALARRMGLSARAHRRSVVYELGGMLMTALVIGAGLALLSAFLVYRRFDPLPSLPPAPLLRLPLVPAAVVVLAVAAASWAGARLVQRRADRTDVAEVMRAAG